MDNTPVDYCTSDTSARASRKGTRKSDYRVPTVAQRKQQQMQPFKKKKASSVINNVARLPHLAGDAYAQIEPGNGLIGGSTIFPKLGDTVVVITGTLQHPGLEGRQGIVMQIRQTPHHAVATHRYELVVALTQTRAHASAVAVFTANMLRLKTRKLLG